MNKKEKLEIANKIINVLLEQIPEGSNADHLDILAMALAGTVGTGYAIKTV